MSTEPTNSLLPFSGDIPNWLSLAISLILPLLGAVITIISQRWKRRRIKNLSVQFGEGEGTLNGQSVKRLEITFVNRSAVRIFLENPSLREISSSFNVHDESDMDVATRTYELKFQLPNAKDYTQRYVVIESGQTVKTVIPLSGEVSSEILQHGASRLRQCFKRPKFFTLEFEATKGHQRARVAMVH